jgi:hypothetical protein
MIPTISKTIGLLLGLILLSGCSTLFRPVQNTPQPWAQPEPWQGSPGIPGLSSSDGGLSGSGY